MVTTTGEENATVEARSLRDGFVIKNPKVLLVVTLNDGERLPVFGTNRIDDWVAVLEHIVCSEKNVPFPEIREYCMAARAKILVRDVRSSQEWTVAYSDAAET